MESKTVCPLCNGSGIFKMDAPHKLKLDTIEIKKQIAIELHKKGYSIRQIQKALGYKSPLSIQLIISKTK